MRAFTLIEAILATSLFGLLITALVGVLIYGNENSVIAQKRTRALSIAEEGIEAIKSMRDENFNNVPLGTHGLIISEDNKWTFAETQDITDIFTRSVAISSIDTNTKQANVTVTWKQNATRDGSIILATYFTNWLKSVPASDHLLINTAGARLSNLNKDLIGITIQNTGTAPITIDKMTVFWTVSTRSITIIRIGGANVWTQGGVGTPRGAQPSGTRINIQDITLNSSTPATPINYIRFDGSMAGNIFAIDFTMSDGSKKTVAGIAL